MTYVKISDRVLTDLIELQKDIQLSTEQLIEKAIRQFIDREKSNDNHIWINGIRYPIPRGMH